MSSSEPVTRARVSNCLAGLLLPALLAASLDAADPTVGEVLRTKCVGCHGPSKQSGKLRLDSRQAMLAGGRKGAAIKAGASAASLLWQRVQPGVKKRMPPEGKGEPLTAAQVEALRVWIDAGAKVGGLAGLGRKLEPVVLEAGSLPSSFAPVYAVAGDPSSSRVAIGRGSVVEIHEIPASNQGRKARKGDSEQPAPVPRLVKTLASHADVVQSLAFSADGKLLASGEYRIVRVWQTSDWKLVATLDGHVDRVAALVFSPDGKLLVAGGGVPTASGEIRAWEITPSKAPSPRVLWTSTEHSDTVLALDWSRDGARIITGGADRVTYLLDAKSGGVLRRLEGHTHHVLSVAIRPDGKQAATVGADSTLRLWDLENDSVQRETGKHEGAATAVSYQPGGKQVITTSGDGEVRFWDTKSCRERRAFRDAKGYLQAGAFFLAGKRYAAAEQTGALRVYDIEKNRLLFTVEPAAP